MQSNANGVSYVIASQGIEISHLIALFQPPDRPFGEGYDLDGQNLFTRIIAVCNPCSRRFPDACRHRTCDILAFLPRGRDPCWRASLARGGLLRWRRSRHYRRRSESLTFLDCRQHFWRLSQVFPRTLQLPQPWVSLSTYLLIDQDCSLTARNEANQLYEGTSSTFHSLCQWRQHVQVDRSQAALGAASSFV